MKSHIHLSLILLIITTLFSACQTSQREQVNQESNNQAQNTPKKETKSEANQGQKNSVPVGSASLIQVFNEGKKVFNNNCTVCHTMTPDKLIGPGLKDVFERRKVEWVKGFIENSAKMIASGDSLAVAVYNEYHKTQMQSYPFSPQKMDKLLFYMANVGREKFITLDELRKQEK